MEISHIHAHTDMGKKHPKSNKYKLKMLQGLWFLLLIGPSGRKMQ